MTSELMIYLLKANLGLSLFYLVYKFFLRKLTFYTLNRYFLQFGMLFSSLFPLVDWKTWLDNLFMKEEGLSVVNQLQEVVRVWEIDSSAYSDSTVQSSPWFYVEWAFGGICALFFLQFILRLLSLRRIHKHSVPANWYSFAYRRVKWPIQPFSFWKSIYVHPTGSTDAQLYDIFTHEQVHVDQRHTFDLLFADLIRIFNWFNPFAWHYRNAVTENLEFLTDRQVVKSGVDKTQYQFHLLHTLHPLPLLNSSKFPTGLEYAPEAIATHFNFSDLKTRIFMMNKKHTSRIHLGKYLIAVPVLVCMGLILTIIFSPNHAYSIRALSQEEMDLYFPKPSISVESEDDAKPTVKPVLKKPEPITMKNSVVEDRSRKGDSVRSRVGGVFSNDRIRNSSDTLGNIHELKSIIRLRGQQNEGVPAVFIVDGVVQQITSIEELDPMTIASISVEKPVLNPSRFGLNADQVAGGVIRVETKNARSQRFKDDSLRRQLISINIGALQGSPYPIVLIDGEIGSLKDIEDPGTIESIRLIKENGLVAKYGPAAEYGVILITLKK